MYSKKITSTNTNITVEKIDTTETQTKNTNTIKPKKTTTKTLTESTKKKEKQKEKKQSIQKEKKQSIQNHLESLDELSLILTNVSENQDLSVIDTDTLINRSENTKKHNNKKNRITLHFTKNTDTDYLKYNIINKYVKKNIVTITDLLYEKKLIKQKNIPYRILFHIYVNYLNNDMKIIFT
jgi:hypothetical protein